MYLRLAWRNIWRNRRRTLITVSSVMFAVVLSLFLESMSRGSYNHMIDITAQFHTGYLQIQDPLYEEEPSLDNSFYYDEPFKNEILNTDSRILYIAPRIETFMLAAGREIARGALVLGIDLEMEQNLNQLKDRLIEGRFFEPGEEAAVLGAGLANRLNVSVGDSLALIGQGRFGMTASGLFEISGLMDHPLRDMDNQIVYLSLPTSQWLLSAEDHVTTILVTPDDIYNTDGVAESLRNLVEQELRILTWPELMPELLQGIEFDKMQMYLMMGILYVVIGFGLFGTILTMTLERMKEFGLLLSVGMRRFQLNGVIILETLIICFLGVLSGTVVGFPVILYFYYNPIRFDGDIADIMHDMGLEAVMPFHLHPDIFILQASIIFVLAFIISLYPVTQITTMNILEASRR